MKEGSFSEYLGVSDLLLKSGRIRLRIVSGSMVPTLHPGDEITVEPLAQETPLRRGDILLVHDQGNLICHRLVDDPPSFIIRGDAVRGEGQWIDRHQILGKVVGIKPRSPLTAAAFFLKKIKMNLCRKTGLGKSRCSVR